MKRASFTFLAFIHLFPTTVSAQRPQISLEPLDNVSPALEDSFEGILFQPVGSKVTCEMADFGEECGGELELDLTFGDISPPIITFKWEASSIEDKYITIDGNGRTRIELQLTFPCDNAPFQEIAGNRIKWETKNVARDGIDSSFSYNMEESFILLGKCDGCGECEIYTRLQFDPSPASGELHMSFSRLLFSAIYETENVVGGSQVYDWGTEKYIWMRDAASRRRQLSDVSGGGEMEGNIYQVLDWKDNVPIAPSTPAPTPAPVTSDSSGSTASPTSLGDSPTSSATVIFSRWAVSMGLLFGIII